MLAAGQAFDTKDFPGSVYPKGLLQLAAKAELERQLDMVVTLVKAKVKNDMSTTFLTRFPRFCI